MKKNLLPLLALLMLNPQSSYSSNDVGNSSVYSGYGNGQTVTGIPVDGGGGSTNDNGTCTIRAICGGSEFTRTVSENQSSCYQECANMRGYSLCPGTQIPSSCQASFESFNQPPQSCPSGYSLAYCNDAGSDTPGAGHIYVSGGTRTIGNTTFPITKDCGCAPNGKPAASPKPPVCPLGTSTFCCDQHPYGAPTASRKFFDLFQSTGKCNTAFAQFSPIGGTQVDCCTCPAGSPAPSPAPGASPSPSSSPLPSPSPVASPSPSPFPSPSPSPVVSPSPSSSLALKCPPDYEQISVSNTSVCRPKLPLAKGRLKSDFTRNKDGYPVCGSGRIPVTANEAPLNVSTFDVPNSSQIAPFEGKDYPYAKLVNGKPVYLYESGMGCACAFPDLTKTQPVTNGSNELVNKIPMSPFSKVTSQMSTNLVDYSPAAFSKTSSVDGRAGSEFQMCGCPNLNEEMVKADSSLASTVPQAVVCRSRLKSKIKVLVDYDPELHKDQVYDLDLEPKDQSGKLMTEVGLPVSSLSSAIQPYKRRIWACPSGYSVDLKSGMCTVNLAKNRCGPSDLNAGSFASAVSGSATGDTNALDTLFAKTVNKKLACCLNDFTRGAKNFKFDCIDNSKQLGSFDDLWASSDDLAFGGQLNAIILNEASGKPTSGFYTLNGSRCSEFSEFGGEIKLGRIDPKDLTNVEEKGTLSVPKSQAYENLKSQLGKGVPTSAADRVRCPILVRAAIQAECGENDPIPAVQKSVVWQEKKHCSSAKNISVHLQVRQVTEIVGKPVLTIQDSILKQNAAGNISVKKIIDTNNGGDCPAGSKRTGDLCTAQ